MEKITTKDNKVIWVKLDAIMVIIDQYEDRKGIDVEDTSGLVLFNGPTIRVSKAEAQRILALLS